MKLELPPLRERAEDILILAEHFAVGMVKELGGEYFAGFSAKIEKHLGHYPWPGNIRELKNVVERAVYQHGDSVIGNLVFNPFDSPFRPVPGRDSLSAGIDDAGNEGVPDLSALETFDFKSEVQNIEIKLLKQALEKNQFNQKKAADFLNLSYHQLRGYLRKYDLLG